MEVAIPKNIIINTTKEKERVALVAVEKTGRGPAWSAEASLAELASLANTAGAVVVGKMTQKLAHAHPQTYLNKGKIEELKKLKETWNYDTIIIDDELNPTQQEKLEELLETKVNDRIALILHIFAMRARTHEGKLQTELAQLEYNLPRLTGKWSHLERLGAGIGTRGPGESQLETDKRIMRLKITRLKKQIDEICQQRELYRQRRKKSGIPVVSLVGYTNSGKSTLLNALARSDVLAKNELFSTLDPTTRKLHIGDKGSILLTDTVGFIRKLPHTLIAAFKATLEELSEADLLIHVVDLTASNAGEQYDTVEDILKDLKLQDKPHITALNKIDALLPAEGKWDETKAMIYYITQSGEPEKDAVLISATKKWGFKKLVELINAKIPDRVVPDYQTEQVKYLE
jgi:GTP-binding protein HflX